MNLTLSEIIEATGAKVIKNDLSGDEKFTFSTDTRTIKKGEIYLPLKGENFDGEKFIDKALEMGAIGYFATRSEDAKMQRCVEDKYNYTSSHLHLLSSLVLLVEDTKIAYLQLARFYRRKINPKTIAITGSSGKTTTKEMAYSVAKEKFRTHKSELNFNNEIGLCKTILSMPSDTEVLILEMGMRGLGEIELLSKYSEPDISIIANVGSAHIGRLGSRENIAKAKCEIVKWMKEDGILIAHEDELIKGVLRCEDAKMRRCVGDVTTTYTSTPLRLLSSFPYYFSLDSVNILERSIGYSKFSYKNFEYELNIEGDYNIQNALAVIEMALLLGMKPSEINEGLKKYSPLEKRWDIEEVKGFKIINDSYNANPESMRGVIKTVLDIYSPPITFVLGDMGELGENEIKYHQEIGEFLVAELSVNKFKEQINVLTVGNLANEITKKLKDANIYSENFENNLQISRYILDNVEIGTTIVLKASRSMKFEQIIEGVKS